MRTSAGARREALGTSGAPAAPAAHGVRVLHVVDHLAGARPSPRTAHAEGASPDAVQHVVVLLGERGGAPTRRPPGATVHRIGDLAGSGVRNVRAFRELVVSVDPDVVHVHTPDAARGARLALGTLPRRRRPALLLDATPVAGMTARTGTVDRTGRAEARHALGIHGGALVVATTAPFEKASRYDVWLDVAHAVCDADPDVHFVAAGHGPLDTDVRSRARTTGHRDRIHVHRSTHGTHALLAADLVLCTGEQRDRPAGLRDALALGLPVVAAATPGAHDTVRHDVDALLVAPGDRTAFVAVVEALLADTPRRERLGAAGAQRAGAESDGMPDARYRELAAANRAARAAAPVGAALVNAR